MPMFGRRRSIYRDARSAYNNARVAAQRIQGAWRRRNVKRVSGGRYSTNSNIVRAGAVGMCSATRQREVRVNCPRTLPTKYIDQLPAASTTDAGTVYTFGQVCPLATGTSDGNRVGLNVDIHEMEITCELKNGIVGNTGTQYSQDETYKILVLCYNNGQTNADPGITGFINADVGGFYTPNSLRNVPNIDDYTVLAEKTCFIPSVISAINTQNAKRSYSFCVKFKTPIRQRYNSNANTGICQNPIFAYVLTDTAHTGTGGVNSSVSMSIRSIYTDSV